MNEKMQIKFKEIASDLNKFDNDLKQSINSQFNELSKLNEDSLDNADKLIESLTNESEALDKMSAYMSKVAKQQSDLSDEITTRVKEAEKLDERRKKRRLIKPTPTNAQIDYRERNINHFSAGNGFHKLFWVFFIGCFAGVIIEMIWCLFRHGYIESRSGLIWGPFNLVYGFGALFLDIALYKYRNRSKIYSFIGGFITGSVIEYVCSFVQEMLFGSTSWDYSNVPFNINGRICLLYSIFWGILGVVWIKVIYPRVSNWILKIPNNVGKKLTWVFLIFMILNSAASGLAVYRWSERVNDIPAKTSIAEVLDYWYPNEKLEKIYPNLVFK